MVRSYLNIFKLLKYNDLFNSWSLTISRPWNILTLHLFPCHVTNNANIWFAGLESENEQGEFKLLVAMKRLYAFYQAHDITDLADIEKDVSAIITKGQHFCILTI